MVASIPGGWVPCPEGELRRLVERLSVRQRLRHAWAASMAAAVVVTVGLTAAEVTARMYIASGTEPLVRSDFSAASGQPHGGPRTVSRQ